MKRIIKLMLAVALGVILLNTLINGAAQVADCRLYYTAGALGKGIVIALEAISEVCAITLLFVTVGCIITAARNKRPLCLLPAAAFIAFNILGRLLRYLTAALLAHLRLTEYTPSMLRELRADFVESSVRSLLFTTAIILCACLIAAVFTNLPAKYSVSVSVISYAIYRFILNILSTASDIVGYGAPETAVDYASLIWPYIVSILCIVAGYIAAHTVVRQQR